MCAAFGIGTKALGASLAAAPDPGVGNGTPAANAGTATTTVSANPGTTDLAGMTRKRKVSVMQTGILSTVSTSAGGTAAAPTLVAPAASGGGKTALGQ